MTEVYLHPDVPEHVINWRNQPAVWKWCRQNGLITKAHHLRWLTKIENDPSIKMFSIYKVYEDHGAECVGVCGLTSIDRLNQHAEFSLYIAPAKQNLGCGSIALNLLLDHGFKNENLNRIWGESFDGNPAQKMFEKIGMKLEGTLRQTYFRDGKFIDSHIWSMTREEYNVLRIGPTAPREHLDARESIASLIHVFNAGSIGFIPGHSNADSNNPPADWKEATPEQERIRREIASQKCERPQTRRETKING